MFAFFFQVEEINNMENIFLKSVFGQVESGNEWSIKLPDSIIPPVFRLQVFAEL